MHVTFAKDILVDVVLLRSFWCMFLLFAVFWWMLLYLRQFRACYFIKETLLHVILQKKKNLMGFILLKALWCKVFC